MQQIVIILLVLISGLSTGSEPSIKLALLKYSGGGDWYANPTALPNLSYFCNQELGTNLDPNYATVDVGSADLFNYPFVHMTGHGNVVFSDAEASNLRNYLIGGGFLHIDDNYGMDPFVRVAMKKVFPEYDLIELPFSHPIYHQKFDFEEASPNLPGISAKLSRPRKVLVRFLSVSGQIEEREFEDLWATSVQHQIDHLNGKMYFDRLSATKRKMLLKKWEKWARR